MTNHRTWLTPDVAVGIGTLDRGDIVVPDSIVRQDGEVVCGAAPILAGTLRRRGFAVRVATVRRGQSPVDGIPVVLRTAHPGPPAADHPGSPAADHPDPLAAEHPDPPAVRVGQAAAAEHPGPSAAEHPDPPTPEHPHPPAAEQAGPPAVRVGLAAAPDDPDALAACDRVLAEVAGALRERTVHLASPRSFCAGVERAIAVVEQALEQRGAPVYMRKQIVHNAVVVADLEQRGAVFVDELEDVPEGSTVVFSAHGVSPAVRAEAAERGLEVIDATCPLVTKVHAEARRFAARGDTIVLIGHDGHEETEGTLGHAPESMVLVEDAADVAALSVPDPSRVSFLTQTTLAVDDTAEVVTALRDKFPELKGPPSDDICYATTNRQNALRAVASDVEVVLVVGSSNSSNSLRLVELAESVGTPAYLIDTAEDIDLDWVAGVSAVGLTAGASAPPALVQDVVDALRGLGPVTVTERRVATETIQFALPKAVRTS